MSNKLVRIAMLQKSQKNARWVLHFGSLCTQLISKTTTLRVHHAILYLYRLPSLHNYDVKLPIFTFCGGREHKITIF